MERINKLEFGWRDGTLEIRAVPARLIRVSEDEENVTIEILKHYKMDDKNYCYAIGYFQYSDREKDWDLKFVGDRFKDIPPEQASKVWEQLGKVYDVLTEWMRDKSE